MKKFTEKILRNQLKATEEEIKIVLDYQEKLSVITDAEEKVENGFIVNGRELYNQLNELKKSEVNDQFTKWIKRKITNSKGEVRFIKGIDYEVFTKFAKNSSGGRPTEEYKITIDMAKQLCMLENNSIGFNTRRYFILCEKFLKQKIKWEEVRSKQKVSCITYKKEFMQYMLKQKLISKYDPRFFTYAYDVLNLIALGKCAKDIKAELKILDKSTRDNLELIYNERLEYLQEIFVTCFKLGIDNNQILPYIFNEVKEKYGVDYINEFKENIRRYDYLFR